MAKVLECVNKKLSSAGLKPIHQCTICFYYIPMKGCLAYTVLATQMLTPELYENFKFLMIPRHISLTNACLVHSVVGSSLYLFSRPHLRKLTHTERVPLCIFGSVMFNLGSMLLWALSKTSAPDNSFIRFFIGVSGAAGVLYFANRYITVVDSQIPQSKSQH